jgi:nucleoside-diphosphate-sugar epimerase
MRALVTGAAGYLGGHLAPELAALGFDVLGLDRESPAEPLRGCEFAQADLCDREAVLGALAGVDVVVHCASIHPWKPYTDAEYVRCNIEGTWQLYAAAAQVGVKRVVLTSSIAAAGYAMIPTSAWPVAEDARFPVGDIYSLTKRTQEEIALLHATASLVRTIALRPPAFMPAPSEREVGLRLLGTYAVVADIVTAHVAAVEVTCGLREPGRPLEPFEAFNTTNALPYAAEDAALIGPDGDLLPLVRKYWPEAAEWVAAGGKAPSWLAAVYDLSKAERVLGWRPETDFGEWFSRRRP